MKKFALIVMLLSIMLYIFSGCSNDTSQDLNSFTKVPTQSKPENRQAKL